MEEEIREDSELRRAWNELAIRMEHPEVFYTYEWALAVQRSYGDQLRPLVFLAYEDETLVGVVALANDKAGCLVFLTASTADYCDFLSAPDRRQEFIDAVFEELKNRRATKIVLTNLPADSCSFVALGRAASDRHYYLHSRTAYVCSRVVPGIGEERATLKQAVAGKKRLRRNLRELEKRGGVSVRHDTQWDQIEPVLQSFNRAHIARFLATGRISNQIRPERRNFLYELARELSRSGWVAVSRLFVGETAAAWNYGFRFAGSWFWYQPTVSGNYDDFSPGYCLLAKIVQLSCDSPDIDVIDLGLGAEDYKERFATAGRETLYVVLDRSFAGHLREVVREKAAAIVKASPKIENGIRFLISRAARMTARLREGGVSGLLKWIWRRTASSLFAFDKVQFFDWPATDEGQPASSGLTLRKLDSDILGAAAISYERDSVTLNYLMRSAHRLRSEESVGFSLLTAEGTPVHFCWARNFEGFEMAELGRTLQAPCANAVMIFDCFTPVSARGHGFFAEAIAALGCRLRSEGKAPWIFGAATNQASLRGIEKSGFALKFSLGRRKMFGFVKEADSLPSQQFANASSPVPMP